MKKVTCRLKELIKPLVDEDTFTQVQQVLRQHDKNKQRTKRHKYLLGGLEHSMDADSPCWAIRNQWSALYFYHGGCRLSSIRIAKESYRRKTVVKPKNYNCGSAYLAEIPEEFNMVFHFWED